MNTDSKGLEAREICAAGRLYLRIRARASLRFGEPAVRSLLVGFAGSGSQYASGEQPKLPRLSGDANPRWRQGLPLERHFRSRLGDAQGRHPSHLPQGILEEERLGEKRLQSG